MDLFVSYVRTSNRNPIPVFSNRVVSLDEITDEYDIQTIEQSYIPNDDDEYIVVINIIPLPIKANKVDDE